MIKEIPKTVSKKGLKKFCKKCQKYTLSSNTKQIFKGYKTIRFHICLCCGEPYEYRSFKDLYLKIYTFKKPKILRGGKNSSVISIKKGGEHIED